MHWWHIRFMEKPFSRGKAIWLGVLAVAAVVYCSLLLYLGTFTGQKTIDGSIGIFLGLYICSNPAANAIDLLFMERGRRDHVLQGWLGARWIGLNLLVMLLGWFAIFVGATRFANRSG